MSTKTKAMHPADAADRERILTAASFNVHLRLSPTSKINEPATTLAEAAAIHDRLRAERPNRQPMVYAIMADGSSVHVFEDMAAAARAAMCDDPAPAQPENPAAMERAKRPMALGKRAAVIEAARAGILPQAPDFSAETHRRFRKRLDEIVAMAEARDIQGLRAVEIEPISSSRKAMVKYRDLAVLALEAAER